MAEQNSPQMLRGGVATPYLAIFNSQLAVIRDPRNNLPLGSFVTHFEYTYNEEKIDTGKIEIETDNPDIVALTELSYGQGIQLQWGYIYHDGTGYYSPVRKVIITSNDITFGPQGVKISLEISDSSILLKKAPPTYYDNTKGFVKYLEDLCKGLPIGVSSVVLIDYNEKGNTYTPKVAQRTVSAAEIANKYPKNLNTGAEWATGLEVNAISPDEIIHTPTTVVPDPVGVKLLEWNAETAKLTIADPDNFRKVYLEEKQMAVGVVLATARSKYTQISDVCRALSGGPYFIDSRDGNIVIHNVKSQRSIVKTYVYAGGNGELLEFTVKSKYTKTSTEVKQSTEINPDTKGVETNFVQAVVDPAQGNPDGEDVDTYMNWPNFGTFPGGIGWNPNKTSAAWKPIPGKPDSGGKAPQGEYHVMMDEDSLPYEVRAERENPDIVKLKAKTFSSIQEAKSYYLNHPDQITQAEINEYFTKWINDWNGNKSVNDTNGLGEIAHKLDRIPELVIEREVIIRANVNIAGLGQVVSRNYDPRVPGSVPPPTTEAMANAIATGEVDLNSYKTVEFGAGEAAGRDVAMIHYPKGKEILNSVPGVSIVEDNGVVGTSVVEMKTKIQIPINGVDAAAAADSINLTSFMGNDIVESVTNKVKAAAKVIGDPVLESSMNVKIQNVSSKFNGLWYTKKVTHTIDAKSGYTCDIEFVQRTVPVSTVTLKSNWAKKDYGKQVLSTMKTAKEDETKAYENASVIEKTIKDHLKESPEESYVVEDRDPRTGVVKDRTTDMVPYSFTHVDGTQYTKAELQQVIRNLQERQN